jgi:3-phosphoshikimate 1-carboxyvinyltransferase
LGTRSWWSPSTPLRASADDQTGFPKIPGDWSSLGYLLALSWVSGLKVERLAFDTGHPDEAIARHLQGVGLRVSDRLEGTATSGFDVDAEQCPDAIPTLAVFATKLPGPSTFRRTGILRHKESDRLAGICELLKSAGLVCSVEGDTLTVTPGRARRFSFDAHDDHRLAMAATVLARLQDVRVALRGMDCVAKSFPGFWVEAAKAGVQVEAWT